MNTAEHHARDWFAPLLAGATRRDRLLASIGAIAGITLTALFASLIVPAQALPLVAAPIGASTVLLFAVPSSPLAQPWPLLGGNVLSILVGVTIVHLLGTNAYAAGISVGTAILLMSALRCLHPPGGACALLPVIGGPAAASYGFALFPIAVNSLVLVLIGLMFHRFSGHSYPHRPAAVGSAEPHFRPADIDAALAELGETFDVAREDLDALLEAAERHAETRRRGQKR